MFEKWGMDHADRVLEKTVGLMDDASMGLAEQIQKLFRLDKVQGKQLSQVNAMLMALVELLIESGAVPRERVMAKLNAALESVETEAEQRLERGERVECVSCGQEVWVQP